MNNYTTTVRQCADELGTDMNTLFHMIYCKRITRIKKMVGKKMVSHVDMDEVKKVVDAPMSCNIYPKGSLPTDRDKRLIRAAVLGLMEMPVVHKYDIKKDRNPKAFDAKQRKCLRCGEKFESRSFGNRLCGNCNSINSNKTHKVALTSSTPWRTGDENWRY